MVLETVVAIVAAHDDMKGLVFRCLCACFCLEKRFFDVFMSFRPWSGCLDGRLEENLPFASMRHPRPSIRGPLPRKT